MLNCNLKAVAIQYCICLVTTMAPQSYVSAAKPDMKTLAVTPLRIEGQTGVIFYPLCLMSWVCNPQDKLLPTHMVLITWE